MSISKNVYVVSLLALGLGAGCSTAKVRVLPGEDGVNQAISRDIERDGAEEALVKKANEYCEDRGKQMVVVKEEKTTYDGSMDEDTKKNVRNASKAAMIISGPAGVASRSGVLGGVVGGAGAVGYSMTSDRDYEAKLSFKCK